MVMPKIRVFSPENCQVKACSSTIVYFQSVSDKRRCFIPSCTLRQPTQPVRSSFPLIRVRVRPRVSPVVLVRVDQVHDCALTY